jgi:hypothetical protein
VVAVTTGAVSIIIACTALIVACLSLVIQLAVYYCFYKPRLMSIGRRNSRDSNQRGDATGSDDVALYDVVDGNMDEEITLEMRENEAYIMKKSTERRLSLNHVIPQP